MKKVKKLLSAALALLALFGVSAGIVSASNVVRTLNSASTGDAIRASSSIRVAANAPAGVNGLRTRASVSTGQATNWFEEVRANNIPSTFTLTTNTVTSSHASASATGQFQYRRTATNAWQPTTVITRTH